MRLALVTDMHFGQPARHEGKLRKMADHAQPLMRAFVEHMNGVERPDVVVNLGDVIEDESAAADLENYQAFLAALSGIEAPVLHVAGNHDLVNLAPAELAQLWSHRGELFYSREIGGYRLLVLCTHHRRRVDVRLPAEQLAWLESELTRSQLPCLVFVHHPLCEMDLRGNVWFEKQPNICRVAERRRVREVLEQSRRVVGVFSGHAHWNYLSVIADIPYVTLQSLTENVEVDAPGRPSRSWAVVDVEHGWLNVRVSGEHPAHYRISVPALGGWW